MESDPVQMSSRRAVAGHAPLASRRSLMQGVAAVAATALPACTSLRDAAPGPANETPVQLTYIHNWTPAQGQGPVTDRLVARFRDEHPTVQVQAVLTADYDNKLRAIVAAGDLPDIATSPMPFLPGILRLQAAVSPEMLSKGAYQFDKNDMVPSCREMVTYGGRIMAMPYILTNLGLVYNQALFKQGGLDPRKAPETWEEFVDAGRRVIGTGSTTAETQTWGLQMRAGASGVNPFLCLIWQNGGEWLDRSRLAPVWNSPAGVEALQFWVDLVQKHRITSFDQPANSFQNGRSAMWVAPIGGLANLENAIKNQFEWGSARLLKNRQRATTVGGHALMVMKTNKYHEQAWRFVQWFTAPQNMVEFNKASTTLPPWRSAAKQTVWQRYLQENPRIGPYVDALADARPEPNLESWLDVQNILGKAIDAAAMGKQSPKEALDDAAREAAPLIKNG